MFIVKNLFDFIKNLKLVNCYRYNLFEERLNNIEVVKNKNHDYYETTGFKNTYLLALNKNRYIFLQKLYTRDGVINWKYMLLLF